MAHTPVLLVIDMQILFLGPAYRPEETIAAIAGLRTRALAAGVPVITLRQHSGYLEMGSSGWQVAPELAPGEDEIVIDKTTADSFLGTDLDARLRGLGATEVIVTGFATEFCVDATWKQALSHGYDVTLVADGHTTFDRDDSTRVSAARSIELFNDIAGAIEYPPRTVRVQKAAEIDFGPAI
ncbi:isochorismatase [Actinorhabdospora filicis]|uniref:Isochorismatase n=1 Tax=Actinorhabdospora filicis TaxID=1785913 RepID=A0A9W6SM16_9ACTN|nr:cysteine hydrolase family protein [Actinorhabdospora filicis]GLZ79424.1 isochorismatase [Actinorhabdospora filicis]